MFCLSFCVGWVECLCLSVFCQGPHNDKYVQIGSFWSLKHPCLKPEVLPPTPIYFPSVQIPTTFQELKPFIFGFPPVSTNQESREIKDKYPVKEGKSQKAGSFIYKWSRSGKWPQREELGREAKLKLCKIIFVYSLLGVAFSLLLVHISIKECWM